MPATISRAWPTTKAASARRITTRRSSTSVMSTTKFSVEETTTITNSASSQATNKRKRTNASDSDDDYEEDHAEDSDTDSGRTLASGDGSRRKSKRHMTRKATRILAVSSKEIEVSTVPDPTDVLATAVLTLKVGKEKFRKFMAGKRAKLPKISARPNPDLVFAFGFMPYPDQNIPSKALTKHVMRIMDEDLREHHGISARHDKTDALIVLDKDGKPQIDTLVRVIMSQATANPTAQKVAAKLLVDYDYDVDGQEVQGDTPNYHKMLQASVERIADSIKVGGLLKRAPYIKNLLHQVSKKNIALCKERGEAVVMGNEKDAPDFVPGMLSLDFLEDKDKDQLFKWYTELDGVGAKTAHCMMAFAHNLPVCAVDIHVHRALKRLGWIPPSCDDELKAAMQVDAILDDDDKQFFHQLCWHHGQKCPDCKASGPSRAEREAGYRPCVIEQYVNRHVSIKNRHASPKKPGVVAKKPVSKGQKKGSDVIAEDKMTAEAAVRLGYVLKTIRIDDNFDRPGANRSEHNMWVKRSSWWFEEQAAKLKAKLAAEAEAGRAPGCTVSCELSVCMSTEVTVTE